MLTWAAGNGVLIKISLKAIKRIENVLINVTLMFLRRTVVVVVVVVYV